jgi:hypothetical protein
MQRYIRSFRQASNRLGRAAVKTVQEYRDEALPDEPTFTGALVTRLKDSLDGFVTSGISWSAKVLSSHGARAEETEFGADILGLLSLDLPELKIRKGFLAQAKRQEPGSKLSQREWTRLVEQCKRMTSFTPESFVFIYAFNGVFMVPAVTVPHCVGPEDLHTLNPENTVRFYRRNFECHIGDSRIDSATPDALVALRYLTGLEVSGKAQRTVMNE